MRNLRHCAQTTSQFDRGHGTRRVSINQQRGLHSHQLGDILYPSL